MQDFSEWMTALQRQPASSPASSYAETDSDSDSDADDCACRVEPKRASCAPRKCARTAPISIPRASRPHPHQCASAAESPDLSYHADMRLLRAGRYLHEDEQELDEDDPALYGNLAFFRSQCGASQTRFASTNSSASAASRKAPSAAPTSPTGVDDRDEDIFAMEL